MTKISLGKKGEEIAEKFLLDQGFRIIEKNFRSKIGELDLVGIDDDTLVFIEVKTRFSRDFGLPEEAVTPRKARTIARVGEYFRALDKDKKLPESERIDVVAIDFEIDGSLKRVELIKNASF